MNCSRWSSESCVIHIGKSICRCHGPYQWMPAFELIKLYCSFCSRISIDVFLLGDGCPSRIGILRSELGISLSLWYLTMIFWHCLDCLGNWFSNNMPTLVIGLIIRHLPCNAKWVNFGICIIIVLLTKDYSFVVQKIPKKVIINLKSEKIKLAVDWEQDSKRKIMNSCTIAKLK